ncbi:hypothetical protein BOX15_Mlig002791g6, partial [Macrostomum lignano]
LSSSSSSLRSKNRISESVGPPDPRSCIRPVDVKIGDELRDIQARCYRDKRLAAFDLCHKHWAAHNQAFKLAKDRFSIIKRTELAFAPEEQLMPDQMAEFYRQFLEQTRQGQYELTDCGIELCSGCLLLRLNSIYPGGCLSRTSH